MPSFPRPLWVDAKCAMKRQISSTVGTVFLLSQLALRVQKLVFELASYGFLSNCSLYAVKRLNHSQHTYRSCQLPPCPSSFTHRLLAARENGACNIASIDFLPMCWNSASGSSCSTSELFSKLTTEDIPSVSFNRLVNARLYSSEVLSA